MKKIVFVSIDKPVRWGEWHSGYTDSVYHSEFFSTKKEVEKFIEKVKNDYPDNNFIDRSSQHEYFLKFVTLIFDETDEDGFKTLKSMMRAYNLYKSPQKE